VIQAPLIDGLPPPVQGPPALAPIVAQHVAEKRSVATLATYGEKETRAPSGTSSGEEMESFCPWEKDFSDW
jgi:hypothetical protein